VLLPEPVLLPVDLFDDLFDEEAILLHTSLSYIFLPLKQKYNIFLVTCHHVYLRFLEMDFDRIYGNIHKQGSCPLRQLPAYCA
jgi:hypothetical protein